MQVHEEVWEDVELVDLFPIPLNQNFITNFDGRHEVTTIVCGHNLNFLSKDKD